MIGAPGDCTPTSISFDRQLSLQAPPTRESSTCASVRWLQPDRQRHRERPAAVVVGALGEDPSVDAHVDVRVGHRAQDARRRRRVGAAVAAPSTSGPSLPGGGRLVNTPPLAPRPPKIPAKPCGIGKRGGLRSTTMRLVGVSARRAYARKCASISSCVAFGGRLGRLEEVEDVPARARIERVVRNRIGSPGCWGGDDPALGADERERHAPGLFHHAQSPEHVLRIRQRSDRDVLRRIVLRCSRSPRRNAGTPPSADRSRR